MTLLTDTVVIAEDDPEISQMVKVYLERTHGLSVSTTDSVNGILPLVLETQASVLIMDLRLIDGDASKVLPDVAAIDGLLVVILTGTWDGRQEDQLLKDGAQVVMRKPQKPSAIWQQVLNLRGVSQKRIETPLNILFKQKGGYYDVQEGMIVEEGGKWTYLSDKKKEIMDLLINRMVSDESVEGGWVSRDELIKNEVKGAELKITDDIWRSVWYQIMKISKTLEEYLQIPENLKPIENRKTGRENSYYRLNPQIFELDKTG